MKNNDTTIKKYNTIKVNQNNRQYLKVETFPDKFKTFKNPLHNYTFVTKK